MVISFVNIRRNSKDIISELFLILGLERSNYNKTSSNSQLSNLKILILIYIGLDNILHILDSLDFPQETSIVGDLRNKPKYAQFFKTQINHENLSLSENCLKTEDEREAMETSEFEREKGNTQAPLSVLNK